MSNEFVVAVSPKFVPSTIGQKIERYSIISPDNLAISFSDSAPLNYERLHSLIAESKRVLRSAGFGRLARIGVALPSDPHCALAIVAVACSAVAVPLNPKQTLDEIKTSLAALKPNAVIVLTGTESTVRRVAERESITIIEASTGTGGTLDIKLIAPRAPIAAADDEPDADAPAFILQTSGATSKPKLIPFSHQNLLATAARLQTWFNLTPRDRCLSVSPVHNFHCLKIAVFTPLLTGGSVAFPTDVTNFDYLEWFGAMRPTWYSTDPTQHRLVFEQTKIRTDIQATHSLRFVLSEGGQLRREVREGLQEALGVPVLEHYGSSEAALIAANLPPPGPNKPGTMGVPWPETLIIADEEGKRLPPETVGEVLVRGPTVIAGYIDAPETNRASFIDGWLRTGDIASLDEDGFLTLCEDLINLGDEKVSPTEIDEALIAHAAVADAMAFSVPHSRLGEDVAVAVVLRPGTSVSPHDLRAYLSKRLSPFKVPRRVFVVDQLPTGATGRVLRQHLSETLGTATFSVVPSLSVTNNLSAQLLQIWEKLLEMPPITVDDDFFENGLDSLLAQQMLIEIERVTGRSIPNSILFEASTVRKLSQRLSEDLQLQSSPLIPIHPNGRRTPFIFFHGDPLGGHYTRKLANLLGSEQPLFVVSPHGFDKRPMPASIEAMAVDRLPSILKAQPRGPYKLGGYCAGGMVAFETARLLVEAGEKVEMIIMIDPPTINAHPIVRLLLSSLGHLRGAGSRLVVGAITRMWLLMTKIEKFSALSTERRRNWIMSKLRQHGGLTSRHLGTATSESTADASHVATAHDQEATPFQNYATAFSRYLPMPLAIPVVYFSSDYLGTPWRRISSDLKVIKLGGDHIAVPSDPSELSVHLRRLLTN